MCVAVWCVCVCSCVALMAHVHVCVCVVYMCTCVYVCSCVACGVCRCVYVRGVYVQMVTRAYSYMWGEGGHTCICVYSDTSMLLRALGMRGRGGGRGRSVWVEAGGSQHHSPRLPRGSHQSRDPGPPGPLAAVPS